MESEAPTCPRCGYDLSAEVVKWGEACPLHGRCWECGLDVAWADLLRPDRRRNPLFVEHAPVRGVAMAAWRTWWWALRPGRFWTRVRLEHEPRKRRMLAWVALVPGVAWLVHGAAWCGVLWWQHGLGWVLTNGESVSGWLAPAGSVMAWWRPGVMGATAWGEKFVPAWERTTFGRAYLPLLAMSVLLVVMVLVLKETRARAKVRLAHVARAGVYSLAWVVPVAGLGPVLRAVNLWLIANGFATPLVTTGWRGFMPFYHWGYWFGPVAAVWLGAWWWMVLSRGWRLESPGRVWGAMMAGGVLAGAIVLALDWELIWLIAGR